MSSETFGQCLRRLRAAAGLSQSRLARLVPISQASLSRYESDTQAVDDPGVAGRLDELVGAGGALRQLAHQAETQQQAAGLLGEDDELAALELERRVMASDTSSATLDQLEVMFDALAMDYPSARPEDLLPRLRRHLSYIGGLVEAPRKTLTDHRRLLVLGGWFSLLAATVNIDLEQHRPATAQLRTAASLAQHAGHPDIVAWCWETEAWRVLTAGHYQRAATLAERARELAPYGSSAQVQATAQAGRAAARLGLWDDTYRAVDDVQALSARMATPDTPEHHYRYDPAKALAYQATTLAWLGASEAAEQARQVIETFRPADDGQTWPRRYATAHVDLALVEAKRGELDAAADAAQTAMMSQRIVPSNWWRLAEVVRTVGEGQPSAARQLEQAYRHMTGDPGR
ncbi:hypothetical protein GCM10009676_31110 [Prauserella halophila]|uniref:HTH cro/C1-type domain-containing protein n=1 Tax=Prauserella halophila TaxID=185641 RepID=A0ABP4GYY5_9PSEU|nr:helix-turn-helix transcriptional regulator [Prauserella halophila]MCP2234736.1 Helix-turn-helix domain-containing protein [Prauserella halophila]